MENTFPLPKLAAELLFQIVESGLELRDLARLARSCKTLYAVAWQHLFRHHAQSALIWAAKANRIDYARRLLDPAVGVDLNVVHHAGHVLRYDDVIRWGSWSDAKGGLYGLPLHHAAHAGHDEMVAFLLDRGARLDMPSYLVCNCSADIRHQNEPVDQGCLPLYYAICGGHTSTAHLLLDRGASTELCCGKFCFDNNQVYIRQSLIHAAAAQGLTSLVKRAIAIDSASVRAHAYDAYAWDAHNAYATHASSMPVLHWASYSQNWASNTAGHLDHQAIIDLLLEAGADLEAIDKRHITPLFWACRKGNFAAALHLLRAGASPSSVSGGGPLELLHLAVSVFDEPLGDHKEQIHKEQIEVVRVLLEKPNFKVNGRDLSDQPHLLYAAILTKRTLYNDAWPFPGDPSECNPGLVKLLLEHGADPNAFGGLGMMPLVYALAFLFKPDEEFAPREASDTTATRKVVSMLLKFKASFNVIQLVAHASQHPSDLPIVEMVMNAVAKKIKDADVDDEDYEFWQLLSVAHALG